MNTRPLRSFIAVLSALIVLLLASSVRAEAPSFANDVMPVLTRFGCNSGGCHGKLAGQNGFKLSLRGYAPDADFESLARESQGRRINAVAPSESLLIRKAVGALPHGGGQRFKVGSPAEKVLLDWIVAGTPGPKVSDPLVERLEIEPLVATLKLDESRPIQVTAVYSDGQKRDVTWMTQFASNNSGILEVSDAGEVKALRHGEAVVRASFQGQVGVATLTMPHETATQPEWYTARNNAIDEHVYARLAALRIEPSQLCDDATFIRRASLHAIGTLPTPDEVRAFLADTSPVKRSQLIDQLLVRPEFIDYWALQLGDLLQNRKERDHDVRGTKGVRAMHQWLRQQLIAHRSWRDIASDVILAEGSNTQNPAVGYFIVTVGEKNSDESEVVDSVAQAFLGTRIGCARCHNHPLEKYTQDDYYHFAAFFSRIMLDRKNPSEAATTLQVATRQMQNLQRDLAGQQKKQTELQAATGDHAQELAEYDKRLADIRQQIDTARMGAVETRQPRTGQQLKAQPLDRSILASPAGEDPRKPLVRWMTDPKNEQFSGAMVNRLWKHFFAVGLVEPVDDLRATNPPSNRELWTLLNREFVSSNYDLRHVMRLVMNSRAYQLSSETRPSNFRDDRFYSHHYARRLPAEVLLDAICQATGDPEQFPSYPLGVRAIQVPDPGTDSYFLSLFGRSERTTACACERTGDVTLPQLLHLQNSDGLSNKLKTSTGRLEQLLAAQPDNDRVIEDLYLCTMSRLPADAEREVVQKALEGADRREVFQDLFWALFNSKEFAFQH